MTLKFSLFELSKSRLTKATCSWLSAMANSRDYGEGRCWVECGGDKIVAYPHRSGWFVSAQGDVDLTDTLSDMPDLLEYIGTARRTGCEWLMVDHDAARTDQGDQSSILVLSTTHLTEQTIAWLRQTSEKIHDDDHIWIECGGDKISAYPHPHGWFISALGVEDLVEAHFDKLVHFPTKLNQLAPQSNRPQVPARSSDRLEERAGDGFLWSKNARDLMECFRAAKDSGCNWLLLDHDAPIDEALPTHREPVPGYLDLEKITPPDS